MFASTYRIYYEDTDTGGVVYHSNYLKYAERCRSDWLMHQGTSNSDIADKTNTVYVVKNINIDYKSPARLGDLITVSFQPVLLKSASMVIKQTIYHDNPIADLTLTLVCVDQTTFKPKKIPPFLYDLLKKSL